MDPLSQAYKDALVREDKLARVLGEVYKEFCRTDWEYDIAYATIMKVVYSMDRCLGKPDIKVIDAKASKIAKIRPRKTLYIAPPERR